MDILFRPEFDEWRRIARKLVQEGAVPGNFNWIEDDESSESAVGLGTGLFKPRRLTLEEEMKPTFAVSQEFMHGAQYVACHRDPQKWMLMYRLIWRLVNENRNLLSIESDEDVRLFQVMMKQVTRDIHKMHAFVRFRKMSDDHYVAWHVPDHKIVKLGTPFFARRFHTMIWTIFTPYGIARWDGKELKFDKGCREDEAPKDPDELEELWKSYYSSIFNPARIKIKAMKREMPVRYWKTLPEAKIIGDLLVDAPRRVSEMIAVQPTSAAAFVPSGADINTLKAAAKDCRGCRLCLKATQTVFGEGPSDSSVVLIGEQPWDEEDLAGRPFVGPTGQLLDQALLEAGINREALYVTNAVKHFKYETQGQRRIHVNPEADEVAACSWWLDAELKSIQPKIIVCLGLTAAQAILGKAVRLGDVRGKFITSGYSSKTLVTAHPSSVLRMPEGIEREMAYQRLVADLKRVGPLS